MKRSGCAYLGCEETPTVEITPVSLGRPFLACDGHRGAMVEAQKYGGGYNASPEVTPLNDERPAGATADRSDS